MPRASRSTGLLCVLGMSALVASCVGTDADGVRHQVTDARVNWERAAINDYRIEVTQNAHEWAGCTWFAEVAAGELSEFGSTSDDGVDCVEWLVTVPELHRALDIRVEELVEGTGTLSVEWTGSGVPESIDYTLDGSPQESLAVTVVFTDLTP